MWGRRGKVCIMGGKGRRGCGSADLNIAKGTKDPKDWGPASEGFSQVNFVNMKLPRISDRDHLDVAIHTLRSTAIVHCPCPGSRFIFSLQTNNLQKTENNEIDGDHLGGLDGDHLGGAQTGGHDQRSHGASW